MKQPMDFKEKPDYYRKPKLDMNLQDKVIYFTVGIMLFGALCLIYLTLDSRIP